MTKSDQDTSSNKNVIILSLTLIKYITKYKLISMFLTFIFKKLTIWQVFMSDKLCNNTNAIVVLAKSHKSLSSAKLALLNSISASPSRASWYPLTDINFIPNE